MKEVTIHGRINVSGQWWDVSLNHQSDGRGWRDVMDDVKETVEKLSRAGWVSSVDEQLANGDPRLSRKLNASPMPQHRVNGPKCLDHRVQMTQSQHQNTPGWVMWYCPHKDKDRYCKRRAKVNELTGVPAFYSTK